jgi:ankyrin repeat protein
MRADAAVAAIAFGRTEILRALLDAGVSPDSRSTSGGPLVIQASTSGNVEALRLLFERGADLRARMPGKTDDALIFAVLGHQREVIRFLVGTGTDWTASISQKGKTPLQLAEMLHDTCALELLQPTTNETSENALAP